MPEPLLQKLLPPELTEGLTHAERVVLKKAGRRAPAKFAADEETSERVIRAEFLYWLCTDPEASKHVHVKGIWIEGATVDGVLDFEGATLPHPLWLINCDVPEEIVFRDAYTRSIRLSRSRTGSISAQRVTTRGFIELRDTQLRGKVSLSNADIGGNLNCEGAVIDSGEGREAFRAHRLTVRGGVILKKLKAHGTVRLQGAKIEGELDCDSASIGGQTKEGVALHLDAITVSDGVVLRSLKANGTLRLVGAKIDGDLNFDGATLHTPNKFSVNARNLSVTGTFFWRGMKTAPTGVIRLLHASVGQLTDDAKSWPEVGKLMLEGFVYGGFGPNSPQTAAERLHWLDLQSTDRFWPQPYEQLARVFRLMGREVDARLVLIAKQEARRKHANLNRRTKAWLWFLGKSIRYGYEPWRVIGFMAVMILIGSGLFSRDHMIRTTDFEPTFNAFVYSLDVFVPLVDLHQERYYHPSAASAGGAWILGFFWVHIIAGWVSSTLLVAALTGLIRKD